jgi:hypothetical protein
MTGPLTGMTINPERSTVTIDGHTFPTAIVICPESDRDDESEWDRSLGIGGHDFDTDLYIPVENGLLVEVGYAVRGGKRGLLDLSFLSRRCEQSHHYDEWVWLPCRMVIKGDRLVPSGKHMESASWTSCYPDWVVEMIDRWGGRPVTEPDGPAVKLVPLNYFD